jgi:DNA (cytosine-5)-methyltransferase 1
MNEKEITFVDFFAGIGGFHCAIKNVIPNAKCLFASEIDKETASIYKLNHNVDAHNDITKQKIEDIPKADFIFAGFPCQPFSRNGKYYNLNDMTIPEEEKRAVLFKYVIDYLKIHKPLICVMENVKGLLSIKDNNGKLYIDQIQNELNNVGYIGEYKILDSADFDLPQQRKRIYFAFFRNEEHYNKFSWPERIPRTKSIKDIMETNVNDIFHLKNFFKDLKNKRLPGNRIDALRLDFANRGINVSGNTYKITPIAVIYGDTPSGAPRQQDKLYSKFGISPTIATFPLSIPAVDDDEWRKLTPRECANLQGFPSRFILHPNNNKAYRHIGNAISINVAQNIIHKIYEVI